MTKVQLKYTTVQKATLEKISGKPYSDSQRTEQIVKSKRQCVQKPLKRENKVLDIDTTQGNNLQNEALMRAKYCIVSKLPCASTWKQNICQSQVQHGVERATAENIKQQNK